MNKKMLNKRLHFIKASPIPKRASKSMFSKRDINHIQEESHPNEEFRSFFDYEDDLSSIKPSNEFFVEDRFEEVEPSIFESGIEMEELDLDYPEANDGKSVNIILDNDNNDNENETNKAFFEISDSNCIYYLSNGNRCEKQKSEGSLFCKIHQQL